MVDIKKIEGLGSVVATGKTHQINYLDLSPEWEPLIYQIESKERDNFSNKEIMTGDKAVGGANGLANVQAKQLGNRTEWLYNAFNYLLTYLQNYTPDGATKVQALISADKPDDNNKLWLQVEGEAADANPELIMTTEDGEQFNFFDGKTIIEIDGMRYALVGENAGLEEGNQFVTLPGGNDTQSSGDTDTIQSSVDTVPASSEDTISAEVTLPADTVPSGNDDDNYAGQSDYDTLINDLWGDDNG